MHKYLVMSMLFILGASGCYMDTIKAKKACCSSGTEVAVLARRDFAGECRRVWHICTKTALAPDEINSLLADEARKGEIEEVKTIGQVTCDNKHTCFLYEITYSIK